MAGSNTSGAVKSLKAKVVVGVAKSAFGAVTCTLTSGALAAAWTTCSRILFAGTAVTEPETTKVSKLSSATLPTAKTV